ncbi:chorismate-binding protein [Streptomyces echinatus]|uniref:chorismate-binding protein n=1 Tax=Streptomyces echinatus TaxID=67293 RepID=UPI003CD06FF8
MDHWEGSVLLIANAINPQRPGHGRPTRRTADAVARLDAMEADLTRAVAQPPAVLPAVTNCPEYTAPLGRPRLPAGPSRTSRSASARARPSRSCSPPSASRPRARRAPWTSTGPARHNPSPYMYLFRFDGFDVVGSSPEALVKVEDGRAMVHPIAGTRHRRDHPAGGPGLARNCSPTPRERAEHLMLVDLGRQRPRPGLRAAGSVEVVDASCPSSATRT